jgi:hypothetical protein
MARALIYLSILSIPGAEELGILFLTGMYVVLVVAAPFIQIALSKNNAIFDIPGGYSTQTVTYLAAIPVLLVVNYFIAESNHVELSVWLSRAVHLALVPFFYFSFRLSRLDPEAVFRDVSVAGIIEVFLIFATFIAYFDSTAFRRAADIEGVILYSVLLVVTAFYAIQKYNAQGMRFHLVLYVACLVAAVLTGTRGLIIAIATLLLASRNLRSTFVTFAVLAVAVIPIAIFGLFDRFDLTSQENMITVSAKLEELILLWRFFVDNPVFGVGLGRVYQVSIAPNPYTYSHNVILFYLGYTGLIGLLVALYPLIRIFIRPGYRIFVMAILVYYTSSTTFTNIKHSILLALILLLIEFPKNRMPTRYRLVPAGTNAMTARNPI